MLGIFSSFLNVATRTDNRYTQTPRTHEAMLQEHELRKAKQLRLRQEHERRFSI